MSMQESVQASFDLMRERFQPQRAGSLSGTFQFNITGEGGGHWCVTIKDQALQVTPGQCDAPSATIVVSAEDWLKLLNRQAWAESLYNMGRLQVFGDLYLAERLQYLFA